MGYLSIGSNIGQREASVLMAARYLDKSEGLTVVKTSSLYESAPFECPPQSFFINMVVKVKSLLSPANLLKQIKKIEGAMGRTGAHNAPREIDIDIVTLGNIIMNEVDLTIPHPRYIRRAFVLIPLREISPDFLCPLQATPIDELIEQLPVQGRVTLVSSRKTFFC